MRLTPNASLFVLLTTSLCADEQPAAAPTSPEPKVAKDQTTWSHVTTNSAYRLDEWKLAFDKSLIHGIFFETDAQMGIAIAAEIGLLSENRKFPFFRIVHNADELKEYQPILETLRDASPQAERTAKDVRYTSAFVVEFLKEEPALNDQRPIKQRAISAAKFANLARQARAREKD